MGCAWPKKKVDLKRPKDIKGLMRQCHNKLHGRGVDGDEDDLTMDMVRLILAKAMDEERANEYCEFYCTPEEYRTAEGRDAVASRVHSLFAQARSNNSDVFSEYEKFQLGLALFAML